MSDPKTAGNGTLDIESIGVIGAGQMGSGIAHVSALAGYTKTSVPSRLKRANGSPPNK